jgi:hypothetical protein
MATRSTIALEYADGSVAQVYCHWDGYIQHNGKILQESYQNPFKVAELIKLGDLSVLGAEIGVQRPFDNPFGYDTPEYLEFRAKYENQCTFYGRDRGEDGVNAKWFKDFVDYCENSVGEEYNYILRTDGKWYVEQYEPSGVKQLVPLVDKVD